MRDRLKNVLYAALGATVATLLVTSAIAVADGQLWTDTVPRHIQYAGTLERDGASVNGPVEMSFAIYDGAGAEEAAWSETQTVQVFRGRFQVLLGASSGDSVAALAEVVGGADDLYLGIALHTDDGDVELTSRQRFLPVPYALWTTSATNLVVNAVDGIQNDGELFLNWHTHETTYTGGALDVAGNARIAGSATIAGNATVAGTATVGNRLEIAGTDLEFLPHPERGDGGRALVHSDNDALILNFAGDFAGGTDIQGPVNLGMVHHDCGSTTDCQCPAGTAVQSAGVNCPAGSHIMEYWALHADGLGHYGWHAKCENSDGGNRTPINLSVYCSRILW